MNCYWVVLKMVGLNDLTKSFDELHCLNAGRNWEEVYYFGLINKNCLSLIQVV